LVRASGDLSGSRKRLDRCGIGSFQKSRTQLVFKPGDANDLPAELVFKPGDADDLPAELVFKPEDADDLPVELIFRTEDADDLWHEFCLSGRG
jgi:hypothetical protein